LLLEDCVHEIPRKLLLEVAPAKRRIQRLSPEKSHSTASLAPDDLFVVTEKAPADPVDA
jgi:hypothetical protein